MSAVAVAQTATMNMESDDTPILKDPDEAAWVASQREIIIRYLAAQRVEHGGVSIEPRWFVSPCVAVWAIRSRTRAEHVGWWAISGDLPTDYMTSGTEEDAGDILIAFATRWREAAKRMAAGEQPDGFVIGDPARAKELAPLLEARADLLYEFGLAEKPGGLADRS